MDYPNPNQEYKAELCNKAPLGTPETLLSVMKNIFYFIFAIGYTLVFGEWFIRLFSPAPLLPRYVTAAPYGIRMNVPLAQYWQTTPEVKVHFRINSKGIRSNREFSYEKPTGQCRIVLFGDSFFMGYEVNLTDSFAYLLEHKLRAKGYPCEVINLAVSGFGTAEMLIALTHEGFKYQPDVVVFQWNITDPSDNTRSALFRLTKDGSLQSLNPTYLPAIKLSDWLSQWAIYRWLIENGQLYAATREMAAKRIKSILGSFRQHQPENSKAANQIITLAETAVAPETTDSPYAWRLSTRLLQEAKQFSEKHQAHFCVLEIPFRLSRTHFQSHLSEFAPAIRQELKMWSPLATFQAAAKPELKLYLEEGHFHLSVTGNQLLTDYFVSELEATGWLKK